MTRHAHHRFPLWSFAALFLVAACSGSGGASSTKTSNDFGVAGTSVSSMDVWRLNQPIDIRFTRDVDFATVNSNTINIATTQGVPATGSFTLLADGRTVRFQPSCPTKGDNSDAGLRPGGVQYRLRVLGSQSGGPTVQSTNGLSIETSYTVSFLTPDSQDPQKLFLDTVQGPPSPRVRGRDGVAMDDPEATHLELGNDPDSRVYFVWDAANQVGELETEGFESPLNLYSTPSESVAVVVALNQPINPGDSNVNTDTVELEYLDENGEWQPLATNLTLVANCTDTGATLRLEPLGLLPQGSDVRVILREGFGDLTGDEIVIDLAGFAQMHTETVFDPGTTTPGDGADELLETFANAQREDDDAAFATPHADWGNGQLVASFPFGGSGGPNGNFDWHVPPNTDLILSTDATTIVGGPGGDPTTQQLVVNGIVDVRDLYVPPTSSIQISGPNTCTILATGSVVVEGLITIDGSSNRGVGTLNTTNQPEPGAVGNGGGGKGGTANYLTSQSTPRGGSGFGAFDTPNGGGQGGETGYALGGIPQRRGAGAGGGAFGADTYYSYGPGFTDLVRCQELIGLDAEFGSGGGVSPGKGAESQSERAQGGHVGPRPFSDDDDTNDFLGTMLTASGELIVGELDAVWAGAGGGGGGNAVNSDTFPLEPWLPTGDEKGCGGGGAAGGLRILALGPIEVRAPNGRITADGGQGGPGENPSGGGFNPIGGGGGGGSGGHLVFSSASYISVEGFSSSAGAWFNDYQGPGGLGEHFERPISLVGGQGGAGNQNKGGSTGNGKRTTWRCDRVPFAYFAVSSDGIWSHNPPRDDDGGSNACWNTLQDLTDPLGPTLGAGGDGGPGILQLHVDDPAVNLRFPDVALPGQVYGAPGALGIDVSKACGPAPIGWQPEFFNLESDRMIPFFGKESTSQSEWIALGLARVNPTGGTDQVRFFFEGTDPLDGEVLRDGDQQLTPTPVLGPVALANEPNLPYIDAADPLTIVLDASVLAAEDDVYKRNPALLRLFTVRLEDSGDANNAIEHEVASASYDDETDQLRVTVFPKNDDTLADFTSTASTLVTVRPYHVKLQTSGKPFDYPTDAGVTITFEATVADSDGRPSEIGTSGFVTDIEELNLADWDFFRFRVHFNMSTSGQQVTNTTPRPGMDFVRVPFRF